MGENDSAVRGMREVLFYNIYVGRMMRDEKD
jgi:hypothetical protein